jgi:Transposase DDE domain
MLLARVFDRFVKERPYCVMVRAALERMLLPERLNSMFETFAERQYHRELLFADVVETMGRVVTRVEPSVLAAYRAMKDVLGVSDEAFYQKLRRIELRVSQELVRDSYREAVSVLKQLKVLDAAWVLGYDTKVLDGNHLSASQSRIKELRAIWDAPLPGRALVVWHQRSRLIQDVFPTEDGHASERSLISEVLATVKERDLWIADRNFCTLGFIFGLIDRGASFVFRQHGQIEYEPIGMRKFKGLDADGQRCWEQCIQVTYQNRTMILRRITVCLNQPTREGDREIYLLTDLPKSAADAPKISQVYRGRWSIEVVFLELQTALSCEINTLGYPRAALFTFCLALMLENTLCMLKGSLRAVHGKTAVEEEISFTLLAQELSKAYDGMMVQIPAPKWKHFRTMPLKKFAAQMKDLAARVDPSKYKKTKRGPKKPPTRKARYKNGGHVSTVKILALRGTQTP